MLRSPRVIHLTFSLAAPVRQCLRQSQSIYTRTGTGCASWSKSTSIISKPPSSFSTQCQALTASSDPASLEYSAIYSFPSITILRAISRLKMLQTGFTVSLLPLMSYFFVQGQASSFSLLYTTGISTFAVVMLYIVSFYIRRVVGLMFLDSTHTTLKVAHLTFWGHRRDVYLPVNDIMTMSDTGTSWNNPIMPLKRFSCSDTLYFSPKMGKVLNKELFEKVFGPLP